jgi:Flp pilus assembly protein TadG
MRNLLQDNRGSVLVEAAIVLPVLLFVIAGGMDLNLASMQENRLQFATEAASRCAAIGNALCGNDSATAAYAAAASGIPAEAFTVTLAGCGVQVAARWTYPAIVLPAGTVPPLSATSCYPTKS